MDQDEVGRSEHDTLARGSRGGLVGAVVWSAADGGSIALAVVPRDLAAPGTTVTIDGAGGDVQATVVPLPFRATVEKVM